MSPDAQQKSADDAKGKAKTLVGLAQEDSMDPNNVPEISAVQASACRNSLDEQAALLAQAEEHSAMANECLDADDLEGAVEHFGDALKYRVEVYGPLSPACAKAYTRYGRALLSLAVRNQDAQLVAPQLVNERQAALEEFERAAATASSSGTRKILEFDDDQDDDEGAASETHDEDKDTVVDANLQGEAGQEGEVADSDDFGLAWEILDTARVIYNGQADIESRFALSDAHLDLADLSLEVDNFDASIEDYRRSIEILDDLAADEPAVKSRVQRPLASAQFKLAMAFEYSGAPEKSIEPLTLSKRTIEDRLEEIRAAASSTDIKGKERLDSIVLAEEEELAALLPEIETKLEDVKSTVAAAATSDTNEDISSSAHSPKAINDITTMIKKRKADSAPPDASGKSTKESKSST